MNVTDRNQDEPGPGAPGPGGEQQRANRAEALSALGAVLRQALASVPRDQVVKCIVAALPAEIVLDQNTRLHESKVRKVSVSMPEELVDAVRARTGTGGFSRYVSEVVEREIRHELLGELIDEFEAEHGPIPEELVEQASREWPDYDES
jgi:Arc/MetJ-type ribon-helix-helix transcriptional regulator